MKTILIDGRDCEEKIKEIISEGKEPEKIQDMMFCSLDIDAKNHTALITFAAHTEELSNFEIPIVLTLEMTDDEIVHYVNSVFARIDDGEGRRLNPMSPIDSLSDFFLRNKIARFTDFVTKENSTNIIHAMVRYADSSDDFDIKRYRLDEYMLIGVYIIYYAICNFSLDSNTVLFANAWMIGERTLNVTWDSAIIKVVTDFKRLGVSRTIKTGPKKYNGLAIYSFNNDDIIAGMKYSADKPIRNKKNVKSVTELNMLYHTSENNVLTVYPNIAMSTDGKVYYILCNRNKDITVLKFDSKLYEEFLESLRDIRNLR